MAESINQINKYLEHGQGAKDACPAWIREDNYQLDDDVDKRREPVKGNPEDFKNLYHRGTV